MIARAIMQFANLAFLVGVIFITYYWYKTFQHRRKTNSSLFDFMFFGLSIFFSANFTDEGNRYRKKYWYATLITLLILLIPLAVSFFR